MEQLEIKTINGKKYYYHSKWGKKDGKSRRLWQKYIGTLEDLLERCGDSQQGTAELYDWGLSTALIKESMHSEIVEHVDTVAEKWKRNSKKTRTQGLSIGGYIAIAAINRAGTEVCSKRSMWQWFSGTVMHRYFPTVDEEMLSSQNFWNNMEKLSQKKCQIIWRNIILGILKKEKVDISSISYDGTNFYTFIDTFNSRCNIAKRGKNKQGRGNLRQVSYVLFCSADGHIPLHYELFEGNHNDITNFPIALKGFKLLFGKKEPPDLLKNMTLVFDKGNNSPDNFEKVDEIPLHFVGSVKLGEHKALAEIPNDSPLWKSCTGEFERVKVHRVKKNIYGKERTVLITWNPNLYTTQLLTVQHDIKTTIDDLTEIQKRLQTRSESSEPIKGRKPTVESVKKQCTTSVHRPYMEKIVLFEIFKDGKNNPLINYTIDVKALELIANTYLGKNILITSRHEWDNEKIIQAYRSQYLIEDVFKEMKDRKLGEWWPMFHWTDRKIHVHALYCTIAVLLRAIIMRRVRLAGHSWSLKRVFEALGKIKEVVEVHKSTSRSRKNRMHTLLTRAPEIHDELMTALNISTTA